MRRLGAESLGLVHESLVLVVENTAATVHERFGLLFVKTQTIHVWNSYLYDIRVINGVNVTNIDWARCSPDAKCSHTFLFHTM